MIYRKHHTTDMSRPIATPGPVLFWQDNVHGDAVIFSCPCTEREIYVTTRKGHRIEFDDAGLLTIHGSIGGTGKWKGENLCHFWVENGAVEMCSDCKCPGSGQ